MAAAIQVVAKAKGDSSRVVTFYNENQAIRDAATARDFAQGIY
jgi:hypothetical protein